MVIKQLSEINYSTNNTIVFDASVIEIQSEGDGEKRPFKVLLKLEESGENISVVSWKFDNLQLLKGALETDEVFRCEASAGTFGNYGEQIRLGNVSPTGLHSTKKVIRVKPINDVRREIGALVTRYIRTDYLRTIIDRLVLTNDDFFKWPAATKVHHNYQGGLAIHSLGVVKNAISMYENYKGENIDSEVLVAGALLHDIGKLDEYTIDGNRTIFGNLIPHPVSGAEKVATIASNIGYDSNKELKLLMLKHIILSHHEKLEFGAPVMPYITEAWIVANADSMDARMESINATMSNLQKYEASDQLLSLDKGRVLKWN